MKRWSLRIANDAKIHGNVGFCEDQEVGNAQILGIHDKILEVIPL